MDRKTALFLINAHEAELKALGVVSLSLFGSVARDEAREDSDIDVAVKLENIPSGFGTLRRLDVIRERLQSILGVPVDVFTEPGNSSKLKALLERDRALAF